jgi:DNA-binding response OmpR family regulator
MKILLIEDDSTIFDNIALTLKVGWPETELFWTEMGEEGIELASSISPDIVILDLGLPDISGFEVLKAVRLFSRVPIVILTVREEETAVVRALELGADEYINKPFRQMELIARLKSITKRFSTSAMKDEEKCGPFYFNYTNHNIKYKEKTLNLSRTEMLVLKYLACNQGHVLTYNRIAEKIWESDYPGSKNAIRVLIRQLRKKLEDDPDNPGLILTEPKIGYYLAKY